MRPKVSIAMITYNHDRFIAEAIESALMQQTSFEFELVIGEDHSTDGTREIVRHYAERHPHRICALLHERNVGMQENLRKTLAACRGEYIAILEGDDYLTHPLKFQRQVDFLDGHPEYSFCFHRATMFWESGTQPSREVPPPGSNATWHIDDFLTGNPLLTSSALLRSTVLPASTDWFSTLPCGDWAIWILAAEKGDVHFIDENMSAYRVHSGGAWGALERTQRDQKAIEFLEIMHGRVKHTHRGRIAEHLTKICFECAQRAADSGDASGGWEYLRRSLRWRKQGSLSFQRQRLGLMAQLKLPLLYRLRRTIGAGCGA